MKFFFPFSSRHFWCPADIHTLKGLRIEPHCNISPRPLPTLLQMTSECEHSPLNTAKAIICFLSGELSLLSQTSGERQMAALWATPASNCFFARGNFLGATPLRRSGNQDEVFKKNSKEKEICKQFCERHKQGDTDTYPLSNSGLIAHAPHLSSIVLNAKAQLHSSGPPEVFASEIIFKFICVEFHV